MSIKYPPSYGQILICDFPKEFSEPEMVKRRPVVCLTRPNQKRHGLVTVVPLSTTAPKGKTSFDVEIVLPMSISPKFNSLFCWAKCDMLYTFSYSRFSIELDEETLEKIRTGILFAISH